MCCARFNQLKSYLGSSNNPRQYKLTQNKLISSQEPLEALYGHVCHVLHDVLRWFLLDPFLADRHIRRRWVVFFCSPSLSLCLVQLRDIPLAPGFGASSLASTPGFTSTATTAPGSPVPMSPSEVETHLEMMSGSAFGSDVGAGGHGKAKKKRRPKPRMHELSTEQAEAKRNANRESARKCRERKRQRERVCFIVL
jgi:hypothetical protein